MKKDLFLYLAFGYIGVTTEVFFTAIAQIIHSLEKGQQVDLGFKGVSWMWMFPIYGLVSVFFPIVNKFVKNNHFLLRGLVYGIVLIMVEFVMGALLDFITGSCPWDYKTGWQIKGYVRIDFLPWWAFFCLMNEKIYLFLDKHVVLPR